MHINAQTRGRIRAHTHAHKHTRSRTHTHAHTHTRTHAHTHTRTHTHTHTHTHTMFPNNILNYNYNIMSIFIIINSQKRNLRVCCTLLFARCDHLHMHRSRRCFSCDQRWNVLKVRLVSSVSSVSSCIRCGCKLHCLTNSPACKNVARMAHSVQYGNTCSTSTGVIKPVRESRFCSYQVAPFSILSHFETLALIYK